MGTSSSTMAFAQGAKNIRNQPVPLDDHKTWKLIFTSSVKLAEVHAIFDTRSIRMLRQYSPESLAILIYKCIDQMVLFTAAATSGSSPADATACRVALQVLSRVLPFAFEDLVEVKYESVLGQQAPADEPEVRASPFAKDFARHLFFEGKTCNVNGARFPPLEQGLTLGQSLTRGLVGLTVVPGFTIGARQAASTPVPAPQALPGLDPTKLWCSGIGSAAASVLHFDSTIVENRLYVLRCMVASLVMQAYRDAVLERDWVRAAYIDPSVPHTMTLAASLFNTLSGYTPDSEIPYAAHMVTNYEELVLKTSHILTVLLDDTDFYPADQLSKVVIANSSAAAARSAPTSAPTSPSQVPPPARDGGATRDQPSTQRSASADIVPESPIGDAVAAPTGGSTVRNMLAAITRNLEVEPVPAPEGEENRDDAGAAEAHQREPTSERPLVELHEPARPQPRHSYWETALNAHPKEAHQFLLGLIRLASNSITARNVYLPGSKRSLGGVEFFMILLYKLLVKSSTMREAFLADRAMVRSLLLPLLDFAMAGVTDPHRSPQLRCAIHLLAQLSAHREFSVALNAPFNAWIPYKIDHFSGTYADLLFVTLHSIFVTRTEWVKIHQTHVAAILSNVAPFCTSLCPTTSTKLVGLLDSMCTASWVQVNPALHSRLLQCVVCTIASLLQYQYKASVHLMYALLRSPKAVKKLVELSQDTTIGLPEGFHKSEHVFTISRAVEAATQELEAAFTTEGSDLDTTNFLANLTLVGQLPAPHRLELLHFPSTPMHDAFIASWAWSIIYVFTYPQFIDTDSVKSFHVKRFVPPPPPPPPSSEVAAAPRTTAAA